MIGILAVQGGFIAHQRILEQLDVATRLVKLPRHLEGLRGLILPGGESTTMLKLLDAFSLFEPVRAFGNQGHPVLGTCAGAILMSQKVNFRNQRSLGWIPVSIDRNAYGSQQDSFRVVHDCPGWDLNDIPSLFIRAPRFLDVGRDVTILSRWENDITGVVHHNFTAVTYHPELGDDVRFHTAWLERFGLREQVGS